MFATIGRRIGGAALVTCVLATPLGCDDAAQTHAAESMRRTMPSGVSTPLLPDGVRNGQSVSYVWEFETRMSPSAYAAWLREQLTDFQMVESTLPRLHFAKLVGGDAYRLSFTIEGGEAGVTHVHGQLIVSPD